MSQIIIIDFFGLYQAWKFVPKISFIVSITMNDGEIYANKKKLYLHRYFPQ